MAAFLTLLLTITLLLLLLPLSSATSTMASESCANELVSFSPCLPFAASPPNNFSSSASHDCCNNYNQILISGRGFCLCYLLTQPPILGAPLDSDKVLSLSIVCPPPSHSNFGSPANFSLLSFCSDSEASPPLQSAGPDSALHSNSTEQFPDGSPTPLSPSPEMDLTPTLAESLPPPPPGFHLGSLQTSSATRISLSAPLPMILSSFRKIIYTSKSSISGGACVFWNSVKATD